MQYLVVGAERMQILYQCFYNITANIAWMPVEIIVPVTLIILCDKGSMIHQDLHYHIVHRFYSSYIKTMECIKCALQPTHRYTYRVDVYLHQAWVLAGNCHEIHLLGAGDKLKWRSGDLSTGLAASEKVQKSNSPQMPVEHTSPVVAEVYNTRVVPHS